MCIRPREPSVSDGEVDYKNTHYRHLLSDTHTHHIRCEIGLVEIVCVCVCVRTEGRRYSYAVKGNQGDRRARIKFVDMKEFLLYARLQKMIKVRNKKKLFNKDVF